MGDRISIVDISWFVNLQRLEKMGYPLSRYPELFQYYQRLQSRPAFKADAKQLKSRVGGIIFAIKRISNGLSGNRIENYL